MRLTLRQTLTLAALAVPTGAAWALIVVYILNGGF